MEQITYRVIRSRRKTVALQICADGEVVVRAPVGVGAKTIERFVQSKRAWLQKHLESRSQTAEEPKLTQAQLQELAREAAARIPERVAFYAPRVGVSYGRITIRSQRTRWGSCSGKGNLNFNCLLMLAPQEVADYVVVHELCHRKEMNHSPRFWAEVARVLPDYPASRKWLKENGARLIGKLP